MFITLSTHFHFYFPMGQSWAKLGQVGAKLGQVELSWAKLGQSWAKLGQSWAKVGPSWGSSRSITDFLGFHHGTITDFWGFHHGLSWAKLGQTCSNSQSAFIHKTPADIKNAQVELGQVWPNLAQLGPWWNPKKSVINPNLARRNAGSRLKDIIIFVLTYLLWFGLGRSQECIAYTQIWQNIS